MELFTAFFRCPLDEKVAAYRMIKNSIGASMATASAVHILVKTEQEAEALKQKLAKGADFAVLAKKHSICPSGKKGGDLGEFRKGQMVKAFDQVVFTKPLYKIHGPIKTQFGYHLIKTLYRS